MTEDTYSGTGHLNAMEGARNYNQYLVDTILQASPAINLLDFGAGMGTLATALRKHGRKPVCVEPDPQLNQILQDNGHEVFESLAEVPSEIFEFIYSFNVLEHIEDDGQALREIWEVLKPGGILLLYVPAFPILYSAMDRKVGHYRRYRMRPICRLLEENGYHIEQTSHADSLGFIAALIYKLIGDHEGEISLRSITIYDKWVLPASRLLDNLFHTMFGKNIQIRAVKPA